MAWLRRAPPKALSPMELLLEVWSKNMSRSGFSSSSSPMPWVGNGCLQQVLCLLAPQSRSPASSNTRLRRRRQRRPCPSKVSWTGIPSAPISLAISRKLSSAALAAAGAPAGAPAFFFPGLIGSAFGFAPTAVLPGAQLSGLPMSEASLARRPTQARRGSSFSRCRRAASRFCRGEGELIIRNPDQGLRKMKDPISKPHVGEAARNSIFALSCIERAPTHALP